jgi:hypothetical protein
MMTRLTHTRNLYGTQSYTVPAVIRGGTYGALFVPVSRPLIDFFVTLAWRVLRASRSCQVRHEPMDDHGIKPNENVKTQNFHFFFRIIFRIFTRYLTTTFLRNSLNHNYKF